MQKVMDLDMLVFQARERLEDAYPGEDERARWQELKRFIQIIIRN